MKLKEKKEALELQEEETRAARADVIDLKYFNEQSEKASAAVATLGSRRRRG